jgi:kynureninase
MSRNDHPPADERGRPAAVGASRLAPHYARFRVSERLLLTGHSHQAWPDVAFEAQQRAWLDAADLVDDKWQRASEVADQVRAGWRRLLNDHEGAMALGQNTHELVVRWLSALLPMCGGAGAAKVTPSRPRIVTTDGEFHTIRRQLDRLAEEGLDVAKIPARPVETLAERLAATVDDRTVCVLVSSVLFETAEIVPDLGAVADACAYWGAALLIDAYHHVNVVPFDIEALRLQQAFVVGGGYKYCQLGEGNCFLRMPDACELRPVITGWFSEFEALAETRTPGEVAYGRGAARFAGATFDPTSHYRAAAVFAFHQDMQLTPDVLRAISRHQVALLAEQFVASDIDPAVAALITIPADRRAGFLALRSPHASSLVPILRQERLFVDARGDILRLGPAPYVADQQLRDAVGILRDALSRI